MNNKRLSSGILIITALALTTCAPRSAAPPDPLAISSSKGPLPGATITLYILEAGGALTPVALSQEVRTAADGTYLVPALPSQVDGKTLVVKASGGSFTDKATGQIVSFEGHAFYAAIPLIDLDRPQVGVVTPLTDLAFRLAKHSLTVDPSLSPALQAGFYNAWMPNIFGILDTKEYVVPFDITQVSPANLYDGGIHPLDERETRYALALAGLSQEAADAGVSPVVWLEQISADAEDDGILNGAAAAALSALPAAIDKYLAGPRNPFATPTPTPPGNH